MGRLIDADKLLETLQDLEPHCENKDYEYGMLNMMKYYMPKIINDEPTVFDVDKAVEQMHNESDKMCDRIMSAYRDGYRKAIDDFVERLTTYLGIKDATKYGNKNAEQMRNSYGTFMNYEIAESIEDVAEQLKAGEK